MEQLVAAGHFSALCRSTPATPVYYHIERMAERLFLAGEGVWYGALVQKAQMITFLKGILDRFPVGPYFCGSGPTRFRNLIKRAPFEAVTQPT